MEEIVPKEEKGRLIAEGGYGCIFSNESSLCIPDEKNVKYLIKANRDDVTTEDEWDISSTILKDIDPAQQYLLYPTYICFVSVDDLLGSNRYSSKCSLLKERKASDKGLIPILYVPRGGINLENFFFDLSSEENEKYKHQKTWPFVKKKMVKPVLKGLQRLFKSGYIHHDVKLDNLVMDLHTFQTRIIDFGLLISTRQYFTSNYSLMLSIGQGQIWNPPENRFVFDLEDVYDKITSTSEVVNETLPVFFKALFDAEMEKLNYRLTQYHEKTLLECLFSYVFSRDEYIDLYTNAILDFLDAFFLVKKGETETEEAENNSIGEIDFEKLEKFADRVDVYGVGIMVLSIYPDILEKNDAQVRSFLRMCLHPNIQKRASLKKLIEFL